MKNFLILLLALTPPIHVFAASGSGNLSSIATPQVFGTFTQSGSVPLSLLSGATVGTVYSVFAGDVQNSLSASNFYPLYRDGVAVTAPIGHKIHCFNFTMTSGSVANGLQLVSATASFAFNAASLTGGVYQMGAAGKYNMIQSTGTNQGSPQAGTYTFDGTSAAVFPGIQVAAATTYSFHAECFNE